MSISQSKVKTVKYIVRFTIVIVQNLSPPQKNSYIEVLMPNASNENTFGDGTFTEVIGLNEALRMGP